MMIRQRSPVFRMTATILMLSMGALGCRGVGDGAGGNASGATATAAAEDTDTDPDVCVYPEDYSDGDDGSNDTCDPDTSTDTSTDVEAFLLKVRPPTPRDAPANCNKMLYDCLQGCNDRLSTGLNSCASNVWGVGTRATTVVVALTVAVRMALAKSCTLANFKKVLTVAGIALAVIDALFILTDVLAYYDCCLPFRSAYATCRTDCFAAAGMNPPK